MTEINTLPLLIATRNLVHAALTDFMETELENPTLTSDEWSEHVDAAMARLCMLNRMINAHPNHINS